MTESLKDRTVKGLGWSALDNAARYGIQFVIGIMVFLAVCKMTGIKEYNEILKILKKGKKTNERMIIQTGEQKPAKWGNGHQS